MIEREFCNYGQETNSHVTVNENGNEYLVLCLQINPISLKMMFKNPHTFIGNSRYTLR
jgi:hypothetical protein